MTVPGTSPSKDDDVLELGAALAYLLDLGDLGGVLAEDGADAGVGEDVLVLPGGVGLIDRDDGGSGAQRP